MTATVAFVCSYSQYIQCAGSRDFFEENNREQISDMSRESASKPFPGLAEVDVVAVVRERALVCEIHIVHQS